MYTATDLYSLCHNIWLHQIAPCYGDGEITTPIQLQSVWGQAFSASLPEAKVWASPAWHFNADEGVIFDHLDIFRAKQQLKRLGPVSLCLSVEQQLKLILEVGFAPKGFVDYRASLKRLLMLHRLRENAELYLSLDPLKGEVNMERPFVITRDCILVYAVIAKQGAMALDVHSLRREFPEYSFPEDKEFMLLTGMIKAHTWSFGVS